MITRNTYKGHNTVTIHRNRYTITFGKNKYKAIIDHIQNVSCEQLDKFMFQSIDYKQEEMIIHKDDLKTIIENKEDLNSYFNVDASFLPFGGFSEYNFMYT